MRSTAIDRRAALGLLAGAAAWGLVPARRARAGGTLYLSARATAAGDYRVAGFTEDGQRAFDLALPGRGHALAVHPTAPQAVAFARRPGSFAAAVDLQRGEIARRIAAPEGRHFYGHGVFAPDGRLLYATENDFEGERGVLGVYDAARGYTRVGELPSHGIGPHDLALLSDGVTLAVANGGILTRPDLPRVKLNIPTMAPSLAYIDRRDGGLVEKVALAPELHQLSIRHLARGAGDRIAVAMQYEGPKGDRVPLIFTHRGGETARLLDDAPEVLWAMNHYCGSAAFDSSGRIVAASSPRGGIVAFWDAETARFLSQIEMPDVCGVAGAGGPGRFIASSGLGGAVLVDGLSGHAAPIASDFLEAARWDNHLAATASG